MTPDQATKINEVTNEILRTLHDFRIPPIPTDDEMANLIICNARRDLQSLDTALFACFRLMEKYHDFNRPAYPVRERRTPTIDDLEI